MSRVVDIAVSDALRDLEARREEDDDPPRVTAEVTDDGEVFLDGLGSIPWRVPRPPDAPPPRKRQGGRGPEPDLERRSYVEQLWRSGYADCEIIEIVTRRHHCAEPTVRKDIRRTKKIYLKADSDELTIATRKAQMIATMHDLAREARAAGDRSTARYVYDKICRIQGLFAPTKIEATSTTRVEVGLQIEVIVKHLDAAGLTALETVLLQLEAAGIVKAPELAHSPSTPELGPGSVIDVDGFEVDDEGDDDDDED